MERLRGLLREYSYKNHDYHWIYYSDGSFNYCNVAWTDHDLSMEEIGMVIKSKEYWFIEWLVKERKIAYDIPNNSDLYRAFELACISLDNADYITMLLSIQENPIDYLVSILK